MNITVDDIMNSNDSMFSEIIRLWREFRMIDDHNILPVPFLHFPMGTDIRTVYDWFDSRYPGGCGALDAIIEGK